MSDKTYSEEDMPEYPEDILEDPTEAGEFTLEDFLIDRFQDHELDMFVDTLSRFHSKVSEKFSQSKPSFVDDLTKNFQDHLLNLYGQEKLAQEFSDYYADEDP